jgi:cell wall-associated NlpC family hydrolase
VERLPSGRQRRTGARASGRIKLSSRITVVGGAFALLTLIIPAAGASASTAAPASPPPVPASLQAKINEVNKLSLQLDALSQQFDSLRIQQQEAQQEAGVARQAAARDNKLLASGEAAIGQIAAAGYMNGSMSPTMELLQSDDPQSLLNQASIMTQLQQENGDKVSQVAAAQAATRRALLAATQQQNRADALTKAMGKKVSQMQGVENTMNSQVFAQALSVYQQTGTYPDVAVTGDTLGEQALRWALKELGVPYVWGGASPAGFDCSGLVMWAYEHVGVQLPHFTGDQWNSGPHVPYSEAQPGELILMYNLDHVGLYIGNGLMVDAPTFGQVVRIEPVPVASVDGVVQIV